MGSEAKLDPKGGPFVDPQHRSAVLLDRHPLWLEAVEKVVEGLDVDVVGKTTAPTAALALIAAKRPGLFITGIDMEEGEMDGIECVRVARERVPGLQAIVLSMRATTNDIDAALEAGAFAYVIKSAHPDDLASTIRQTFAHSVYLSTGRNSPERSGPARAAAEPNAPTLTPRETEILRLMVEGHSNAQLAKMLWVTEQTVKFHLSNIYRKLNASNRTEAARFAWRFGLVSEETVRDRRPHLAVG